MIPELKQYIEKEELFKTTDRLILAVSGGVDSMVMLHLFQKMNFDFVVAHCNFNLRGNESDTDEIFLRDYCGEKGIEIYVNQFDTVDYAKTKGVSIEMAARELRYIWFSELRQTLNYKYLATAHHEDDLVETMLINLSRGTGIRGLSGIQAKSGHIIRPLLFTNRLEIVNYAATIKIPFREDSSNDEIVYKRNLIRHKILPLFEEINPAFRKNASRTASILRKTEKIYSQKIKEEKKRLLTNDGNAIVIEELLKTKSANSILFEILSPLGFNSEIVDEILHSLHSESGRKFHSSSHRLIKDRDLLLINPHEENNAHPYYIDQDFKFISEPIQLTFEILQRTATYQFLRSELIADFDLEKLDFPLVLKKWKQGEYFQPLGMNGFKKLSDFFIDQKFSLPEKENTWILYSSGKVVWIVGKRIDNRFKITKDTKRILRISLS